MERWSDGHGSSWSYRHQEIGSNGSSSSGTIVSRHSTAYASSGSRCSNSSIEAAAAALRFESLSLGIHEEEELEHDGGNMDDGSEEAEAEAEEHEHDGGNMDHGWGEEEEVEAEEEEEEEEEEETGEDRIRSLVREFSTQSANCGIRRGDTSVVERWVILCLEDGSGRASAAAGKKLARDARSWTPVLDQITQIIYFMRPLFPDGVNLLTSISEHRGKHVAARCIISDRYHLALAIQETMLKILTFIDILDGWGTNNSTEEFLTMGDLPPYSKLISLLSVQGPLSEASYLILTQIQRSTSIQVRRMENEMATLLSAYNNKLGEAIRSTVEKLSMVSMEDGNGSPIPLNPQGSADVHKVTRSVMMCIRFVWANYSSLDAAIRGVYLPHTENNAPPLQSMAEVMMSYLQQKLANISKSFSDRGLRFLFLLNNSYFIQDFIRFYRFQGFRLPVDDFDRQIKGHMKRYLQVSWAPLLSFLFNPRPLCLGNVYSSPLSKFESEFQEIYTTQKHWKVADPDLRRRLRDDITYTILPSYRRYIEENEVTNPKFSPQELMAMLNELFEG